MKDKSVDLSKESVTDQDLKEYSDAIASTVSKMEYQVRNGESTEDDDYYLDSDYNEDGELEIDLHDESFTSPLPDGFNSVDELLAEADKNMAAVTKDITSDNESQVTENIDGVSEEKSEIPSKKKKKKVKQVTPCMQSMGIHNWLFLLLTCGVPVLGWIVCIHGIFSRKSPKCRQTFCMAYLIFQVILYFIYFAFLYIGAEVLAVVFEFLIKNYLSQPIG